MEEKGYCVLCYHGERIPIRITVLRAEEGRGDMDIRSCDGRDWSVRGGAVLLNGAPVDPDDVDIQRPGPQDDALLSSLVDMEEMGFSHLDYPIPDELPESDTTEEPEPPESADIDTAAGSEVSDPDDDTDKKEKKEESEESSSNIFCEPKPKYELIREKELPFCMYRIRALRDIPRYLIRAGDWGGLVQNERNLSQEGDCWLSRDSAAWDESRILDDAFVEGHSEVTGRARVEKRARVIWYASVGQDAVITDESWVSTGAFVEGKIRVCERGSVSGCLHLKGSEVVSRDIDGPSPSGYPKSIYPRFRRLEIETGIHKLFRVVDCDTRRSTGVGITLDLKKGQIKVRTSCFGKRTKWDELVAALYDEVSSLYGDLLGYQIEYWAKKAHETRALPWRVEHREKGKRKTYVILVQDDIAKEFGTPGRVTGKIHFSQSGWVQDFDVSFADWYVLLHTIPAELSPSDKYDVYEIPVIAPDLEWNAPGAEPWESK